MARQGPCGNPKCPAPDAKSGFWSWIPEACHNDTSKKIRPGATCHCRKGDCLRWAGRKEEKKKPGRKRVLPEAIEAPRHDDPCMPEQYILSQIDEIWGHRCLPLCCCPRPRPPPVT